jgi:hypothetical protein
MALSFIAQLSKGEQRELLDDLNYLNVSEIKSFCRRHSIPYRIAIEAENGVQKVTKDDDRKGVILNSPKTHQTVQRAASRGVWGSTKSPSIKSSHSPALVWLDEVIALKATVEPDQPSGNQTGRGTVERVLFAAQSRQGIQPHRATRREVTGEQRHQQE